MVKLEKQRAGRNKVTIVNHRYINSGEFKRKFDAISDNMKLSRILHRVAKKMLNHRSGTKFEDMYWIDLDTLKIVAKEIHGTLERKIIYSDATIRVINQYSNLLTIHTHPDSFPPSINDLNSNFDHEYVIGIVVCHDGKVYLYSANERVNENYYKLVVEGYIKSGYNESEAQIKALAEIQENFEILVKEVTDDGSI